MSDQSGSDPESDVSIDGKPQPRRLVAPHCRDKSNVASGDALDIRGELENAFWTSEHVFEGKFWHQSSTNRALAPALRLDGLGTVTLPLQPEEAKKLILHCKQAPFGMGEQTVVDTTVRNTWEMDASAVQIENLVAWKKYLKGEVRKMCKSLGVDYKASHPRCELYKLLVYEAGSHFLPHKDSIKADGMFASMVVVLPSMFSGGAVHLSHGESTTVLDPSTKSSTNTSILAWFTDITHEVKPITSGYRFALSYNVINTTPVLRPFFTPSSSLVGLFRKALVSWKEREDASPFKIVFLLGHQYSRASLSGSSLKGSDAQVAALLKDLGQELGFFLALATVEYYMSESCEDEGEDDEWTDTRLSIKTPVDLDGNQLAHLSSFEHDEKETIPIALGSDIKGGSAYKEKQAYTGNEGERLERWYRRTVLLLWPELHTVELECGAKFSRIFKGLNRTSSTTPSMQERRVTDYLMRAAISKRVPYKETLQSVCRVATRWKDLDLWKRAVALCDGDQGLGYLTGRNISDAAQQLGFENIRHIVETILENENDNMIRFKTLQRLKSVKTIGLVQDIPTTWIEDRRKNIIGSLKEPKSLFELSLFLNLIRESQADPSLRTSILSQLMALANARFLLQFACLLHVETPTFVSWDDGTTTICDVVRDALSHAISKANFLESQMNGGYSRVAPELAHSCFLACLKTDNNDLGDAVIDRLLSLIEEGREMRNNHDSGTAQVLIPLMPLLAITLRAFPGLSTLPGIERLYLSAVRVTYHLEYHLLGLAAAIWLSGETELVETIAPQLGSLDRYTRVRVKTALESLLSSVLNPSEEEWRPILVRVLKHVDIPQAPTRGLWHGMSHF